MFMGVFQQCFGITLPRHIQDEIAPPLPCSVPWFPDDAENAWTTGVRVAMLKEH